MATLFNYFRSSCSYRVRIALKYKSMEYDYSPVHLLKDGGEQNKTDYKLINPHQQVPAWKDNSITLGQSMAIFLYLESICPQPSLFFQSNPIKFARIMELCEIINSGIQPLQNLAILNKLKDFGVSDNQRKIWVQNIIEKGLNSYESIIKNISGTFSVNNSFTAADAFLIPQIYNAHRFEVDIDKFPNIKRIEKTALQLDFVKAAAPESQPDAPNN